MAIAMPLPRIASLWRRKRLILGSPHNPKFLWVDDAEIVGDRITEVCPVPGNFFTKETERRISELGACCVAFVVRDVSVHDGRREWTWRRWSWALARVRPAAAPPSEQIFPVQWYDVGRASPCIMH
jgi:hypothetical protein